MSLLSIPAAFPFRLLVLIGGGEFSFGETRAIDEFLLGQLGEKRRVAFLPTASGSADYALHFGRYLQTLDPAVETINVPIYRGRDSRRQKNLSMFGSAGLIYVGGGSAGRLLETVLHAPAATSLREAASAGAVVAAIGASATAFGSLALSAHGPVPALSWLTGTVVETSFQSGRDQDLRRLLSLPEVRQGIGIPARTALAIAGDGSTQIIGDDRVALFRKS